MPTRNETLPALTVPARDEIDLLGITIDDRTLSDAVDEIARAARGTRRRHFCFVNAHCLNLACTDDSYYETLRSADRVYGDGTGVRWAGKRVGQPVRDNVNGTDLFPELWRRAASDGLRLFLYGGRPGVAAGAGARMRERYGDAMVVGLRHGYGSDAEVLTAIESARPDIVLVGLGAPRQDLWIHAKQDCIAAPVVIGVGGLFDYYSDRIPRARYRWRQLGVEWAWRLLQEPGRMWRRYLLGNPLFLARVLRHGSGRPS